MVGGRWRNSASITAGDLTRSHYAAMGAASAIGAFAFYASPFVVGLATNTFASASLGGVMASTEFAGLGIGSLSTPMLMKRYTVLPMALTALILLVLGQMLTAKAMFLASALSFAAARLLVGLAEGALYAFASAFASHTANPVKVFSIYMLGQIGFSVIVFYAMNNALPADARYVPLLFGGASLALGTMLLLSPRFKLIPKRNTVVGERATGSPHALRLALASFALFYIARYLIVPYLERIGVANGFSHGQIAFTISLHALAAFAAPVLTALLGARFGLLKPVMLVLFGEAVALVLIVLSTNLAVWGAMLLFFSFLMYLFLPMFNGLVAILDHSGRANVFSITIAAVAAVIGPLISAAFLARGGEFWLIACAACAIYALTALLLFGPLRSADRTLLKSDHKT